MSDERHCRAWKTILSRFGSVRFSRIQCRCRRCGDFHPLDRALGLEGRKAVPGAESICADAASSDSCGAASRKLKNLVDP